MGVFDFFKKKNKGIITENGLNESYFCGYLRYRFYKKNDLLHGKRIEFFENGNIKEETDYFEDKKHGLHKYYYESGEVMLETSFTNSLQHGKTISYYKTGQNFRVFEMEESKKVGTTNEFFKNGNIKFTLLENKYIFFNEKGLKICEIQLDNRKPIGIWKNYRIDGTIEYEIDFNNEDLNSDEETAKKTVYTLAGKIYSAKTGTYNLNSSYKWSCKYARNRLVAGEEIIIPSNIQGPGGALCSDRHIKNTPISSLDDIITI